MSGTEHEHNIEILRELIETIANSFAERLRVDQLEGDAICATTERTEPEVRRWLHETFARFHERLRDIREVSTCPCRACASVGELGLKFIVHRGEFSRQQIGSAVQLHGTDVNLVHRLAKNTVPLREYMLATATTLAGWPAADRGTFVAAPQVLDVGTVDAAYEDLAPVKTRALASRVVEVTADSAKLRLQYRYAGTREDVWRLLMEPEGRRRYLGVPRVDMIPGAKGTYLGAEFHCRHGKELEGRTVFRITACDVPEFMTTYMEFPIVGHAYRTDRLVSEEGGTRNDVFVTWDAGRGPIGAVKDRLIARMGAKFFNDGAKEIATMLQEGAGNDGSATAARA